MFGNMSEAQKSDICASICDMANTVMTQVSTGSTSPETYVYYIYILLGGLFMISEGIGMTKKIPQGSLLELIYVNLRKIVVKQPKTTPPLPQPTDPEVAVEMTTDVAPTPSPPAKATDGSQKDLSKES